MSVDTLPFAQLRDETLFMVWGPPSHGPRSQVFARELGINELHFLYSTTKRGFRVAPYKYSYQAVKTLQLLFQKRPRVVFIQSPPSFAVLFVYLYCALTNGRYVIDAHSDALLSPYWTRPKWLHRFLARKAVSTIVTNEYFQEMLTQQGAHAFILRDIPTTFPKGGSFPLNGDFNVVVVNTFAADEPLPEILSAATDLEGVQFYVTGKKSRAGENFPKSYPDNVHFTDFLPNEAYYALLTGSQAVMCLTTRNHTMQRGACEALSLGKPIITSKWPLLETYFNKGTVHVDNSVSGIQQGVSMMREAYGRYQSEIKQLQKEQQEEWQMKIALLTKLIQQSLVK